MDPIDRIANVFTLHCRETLHRMIEIQRIVDASPTVAQAMNSVVEKGYYTSFNSDSLDLIAVEIPKLRRCLAMMTEIKALARQVFAFNFHNEEQYFVFSQEISFSYAAKLLASMGLRRCHYSNTPTSDEIARAEIAMAMQTPIFPVQNGCMPKPRSLSAIPLPVVNTISKPAPLKQAIVRMKPSTPSPSLELTCHESMPTPRQTRPPLRRPSTTSGRR